MLFSGGFTQSLDARRIAIYLLVEAAERVSVGKSCSKDMVRKPDDPARTHGAKGPQPATPVQSYTNSPWSPWSSLLNNPIVK